MPPFLIVEGHPAEARAVNAVGLVREGIDQDTIDALKSCFKRLFRDAGPVCERMSMLRETHAERPIVLELCDAVEASGVGTHGRAREAVRTDDRWANTR